MKAVFAYHNYNNLSLELEFEINKLFPFIKDLNLKFDLVKLFLLNFTFILFLLFVKMYTT